MSRQVRRAAALARVLRLPQAFAVIAATGALLTLAPESATVPQLRTVAVMRAPTSCLAALVVTFGILLTLDEPIREVPATTPRRLHAWRRARVAALTAVALVVVLLADGSNPAATVAALTGLVGEGLLGRVVLGPDLAWLVPSAHLMAAVTFGATPERQVSGWAWIVSTSVGPGQVTLSLALLAGGLVAWGRDID